MCELDGEVAHPTGAPLDQHTLAALHFALSHQTMPGRHCCQRNRPGIGERNGLGGGGNFVCTKADILREGASAKPRNGAWVCPWKTIDRISDLPVRDIRAHLFDATACIKTEQQGQALCREHLRQFTGAGFGINRIHTCSCNPNEDFPASR